MGLKIGTKVITPTAQVIQKRQRTSNKKKERKRKEGIDYSYYGGELEQQKGDVTHVEFLAQTNEGLRFSVCGHFAIKYYTDSPVIELYINPNKFKNNELDLNNDVKSYGYFGLDAVKEQVFDFVNKHKNKFIVK